MVWPTPTTGYGWRTMNRSVAVNPSLHHRRQHEKGTGIYGDSDQNKDRQNHGRSHQDPAQRRGVLVHLQGLPGASWSLTNALANARSAHG